MKSNDVTTSFLRKLEKGIRPLSIIKYLRNKYGGEWVYRNNGNWEHVGKGYVRKVSILGGFTGDDYCGSELIYYPDRGSPKRVF